MRLLAPLLATWLTSTAQAVVVTTVDELVANLHNDVAITFGADIETTKRIEISGITGLSISGSGYKLATPQGAYQNQIFYIHSGSEVVLSDLTISGGWAAGKERPPNNDDDETGGGLMIKESYVTLIACTVEYNKATDGGGIYAVNSTLSMTSCEVFSNSASSYGGYSNGGGLFSYGSKLTMTDCKVLNNTALTSGGGMAVYDSLNMTSSEVSGNTALCAPYGGGGGGFYFVPSSSIPISIVSTVIANNKATVADGSAYGGAIFNKVDYSKSTAFSISVAGSIFYSNSADSGGSDIYNLAFNAPDDSFFAVYSSCNAQNEFNAGTGTLDCYTCSDTSHTTCGECPTSHPADLLNGACTPCASGTTSCCGALQCQTGNPTCSASQQALCA